VLKHKISIGLLDVGQAQLNYLKQRRTAVNAATILHCIAKHSLYLDSNFVESCMHNKARERRLFDSRCMLATAQYNCHTENMHKLQRNIDKVFNEHIISA